MPSSRTMRRSRSTASSSHAGNGLPPTSHATSSFVSSLNYPSINASVGPQLHQDPYVSSPSCYSQDSYVSTSSERTVTPVRKVPNGAVQIFKDKDTLPPLPTSVLSNSAERLLSGASPSTAKANTPSFFSDTSTSRPCSEVERLVSRIMYEREQRISLNINVVKGESPVSLSNPQGNRPVSLAPSVHSQFSVASIGTTRSTVLLASGKAFVSFRNLLETLENRNADKIADCGRGFLDSMDHIIKELDGSLDAKRLDNAAYQAAKRTYAFKRGLYCSISDTKPNVNGEDPRLIMAVDLWTTFQHYLSSFKTQQQCLRASITALLEDNIQDEESRCEDLSGVLNEQTFDELEGVARLSQLDLSLPSPIQNSSRRSKGLIRLLKAFSHLSPSSLQHETSQACLSQVTIVPSLQEAFSDPRSNRIREKDSFSMSAATLLGSSAPSGSNQILNSSSPTLVSRHASVPVSVASSESFPLVNTPPESCDVPIIKRSSPTRTSQTLSYLDPDEEDGSVIGLAPSSKRASRASSSRRSSSIRTPPSRSSVSTDKSGAIYTPFSKIDPYGSATRRGSPVSSLNHTSQRSKTHPAKPTSALSNGSIPPINSPDFGFSGTSKSSGSSTLTPSVLRSRSSSKEGSSLITHQVPHEHPASSGQRNPRNPVISYESLTTLDENSLLNIITQIKLGLRESQILFSGISTSFLPQPGLARVPPSGSIFACSEVGYDLVFKNEEIFAASPSALIRVLTEPGASDYLRKSGYFDILDTWFTFFRSVTTPEYFFKVLVERYTQIVPRGLSPGQELAWQKNQQLVKLRVVDILVIWLKYHWIKSRDDIVLQQILGFTESVINNDQYLSSAPVVRRLVDTLVECARSGRRQRPYELEESIRRCNRNQPTYSATALKSTLIKMQPTKGLNEPLDQLKIDVFFKDGGANELATALTALNWRYFHAFPPQEIVRFREKDSSAALARWEQFSASVYLWVYSLLTECESDRKLFAEVYELFIDVAMLCKTLRNYNSSYDILLILRSPFIVEMRKKRMSLSKSHQATIDALDEFYHGTPGYSNYKAELMTDYQTAIPSVSLLKHEVRQVDERVSKYVGVIVTDKASGRSECMFEVQRYIHYRRIVRVLEQCYGEYRFPRNDLVVRWVELNCQQWDKYSVRALSA